MECVSTALGITDLAAADVLEASSRLGDLGQLETDIFESMFQPLKETVEKAETHKHDAKAKEAKERAAKLKRSLNSRPVGLDQN